MSPNYRPFKHCALVSLVSLLSLLGSSISFAQQPAGQIKQIEMPGGGRIAYADIPGAGTATQAMIQVLRVVHQSCGVRPQLGQFFQDKAGTTLGVFFTIPAQSKGKPEVQGLALVNSPSADHRSGALVYDTATAFRKTLRPLIARLNQEWPPRDASQGAGDEDSGPPAKAEPLNTFRFQDNTGQIGLPAGWRPTSAAGGAVQAVGPNGEELYFNDAANNLDPTNPQGRGLIQMLTRNGGPLPNHTFSNPFRQGAGPSFISTMQQRARKLRQPIPSIQIQSQTVGKDNSIYFTGEWDAHDGRGPKAMLTMVRVMAPMANGSWTMFMFHMTIPMALYKNELATIPSIWQSFKTNDGLIMAMNKSIAAQITAQGEARNKIIDGQRKNSSTGTGAGEQDDANARGAQAVCNYIRGNAVIGDSVTGGQATVGNDLADDLVKANPDRLQIIQPSQFNKSQF